MPQDLAKISDPVPDPLRPTGCGFIVQMCPVDNRHATLEASMKQFSRLVLGVTAVAITFPAYAQAPAAARVLPPIPFTEFTLPNGLRVILHEDHSVPIVAVNVWYHVGSKNEVPGRTGFAHLFEHTMFQGSKNYD